ncbi:glycosyltransferase family 2 protein [Meiothermus sp. CFH 77666]|uniref:glycosyltransferase family 2 protein n=1 Tax=Meiothermus sp. CFH 77666 TaxID=2817942 RepID=UPI001AA02933|nr:glycosyltransferase family 2 protein [Meiothermus sp. CFH 77666]MBO1436363.1 glycosyltransferase family 2 protein [Meiothermus sp. CFH 77666]
MHDLSIVVVSHNARAVLLECLGRLAQHYPQAEVIVVDSGSSDGSAEAVEVQFPQYQLIRTENRGYPAAVNQGLARTTRPYLVQMNSDVYLQAGDLEALLQAAQAHARTALVGPTLITPEGHYQSFGPLYAFNYWNLYKPRAVAWISGALTLMPRAAYEAIGGMDERFFFYNDDLEWCTRARRKGWQVLLVPRRVLHLGGSSTPSNPRFLAEGYRGGLLYTREYYPALHGLHKKAVWLEAHLRIWLDPNPARKASYSLILNKINEGSLGIPFLP